MKGHCQKFACYTGVCFACCSSMFEYQQRWMILGDALGSTIRFDQLQDLPCSLTITIAETLYSKFQSII
jgi:hypothetical protein